MINVSNLIKKFNGKEVLKDISCEIATGLTFGIIGPNGSGKSTFLRILAGIFPQDSGKVQIDDEPIFENVKIKQQIFFVPDEIYFDQNSTPITKSKFLSKIYDGWDQELFEKYCDLLNVEQNAKIMDQSKERRRQIFLLTGLCTRPKYLFLDETFDSLDVIYKKTLITMIQEHKSKNNMTTVMSLTYTKNSDDFCDQLGLMENGTLNILEVNPD